MNLINRSAVKKYILDYAKRERPGWACERVSGAALDQIDAEVAMLIRRAVRSHPTIGKTFKV